VISGVQASFYRCRGLKIAERLRALCIGMSDKRHNLNIGSWREAGETGRKSKNDSNQFEQNISTKLEKELNRKYLPGAEW
jgi:hypothetical protein